MIKTKFEVKYVYKQRVQLFLSVVELHFIWYERKKRELNKTHKKRRECKEKDRD